jgi:hypothetical protein
MQNQIETILYHLSNKLEDAEQTNGRPCRIYNAYKDHVLTSGIFELESLNNSVPPEYRKQIASLLTRYSSVHKDIFNQ